MIKAMLKTSLCALSVFATFSFSAQAKLQTEKVEYMQNGQVMEGYMAYDTDYLKPGKSNPGVLIYHAWMGIGPHEMEWAKKFAEAGYVAFAPDIYGKGIRPKTPDAAGQEATKYRKDRALMRARAAEGLTQLKKSPWVNPEKIGALGFCFGGGVTLELARSGAPVSGFVSLHGNLDTPNPKDAENIKGEVLVLHGAADPYVPMDQVAALQKELDAAKVDWQLHMYGEAVHAFSDPYAGNNPASGAAYNAVAARRAWGDTLEFLKKHVAP
jgi:dienelactone hydrolase